MQPAHVSFHPVLILLLLFALESPAQLLAAQQGAPAPEKREEVEQQLAQLAGSIAQLRRQMEQVRAEHRAEQQQLREADLAIQATVLQMRELERQKAEHLEELALLETRREEQALALEERQGELGVQMAATYRLAHQSRLKLVLNQDSPAHLNRMLAYYNHITRAQVEAIETLRAILGEIEHTHELINAEVLRLDSVALQQAQVLEQQELQRSGRNDALEALAAAISDDQSRLAELEGNRKDLELLLEKLSDVLADIPADLGQHLGLAGQKGQLPMPCKARVTHAYGHNRAAGMKWQGWVLDAAPGTEARNIAYGRVAFADWLRGYGLLMIIDHGNGFMSLYGYNETLLAKVGDWVESGEVIAIVGNNPGGEQGLYFELRKDGKAVDPAAWLKR